MLALCQSQNLPSFERIIFLSLKLLSWSMSNPRPLTRISFKKQSNPSFFQHFVSRHFLLLLPALHPPPSFSNRWWTLFMWAQEVTSTFGPWWDPPPMRIPSFPRSELHSSWGVVADLIWLHCSHNFSCVWEVSPMLWFLSSSFRVGGLISLGYYPK